MSRVRSSVQAKATANKIYKRSKGYQGTTKSTLARKLIRAGAFSTAHSRKRGSHAKGIMLQRIGAACRANGYNYSKFMGLIRKVGFSLNSKTLEQIASHDSSLIGSIIAKAKESLVK